jgi:(2Fe-2S) ferredoxin
MGLQDSMISCNRPVMCFAGHRAVCIFQPVDYYRYHVFFCVNERADGSACCQRFDARAMRDYAKQQSKSLGLAHKGGVRINTAGCLDRCDEGPVIVIYPEGVWYTYVDREDIDEIIQEHLVHGRVVERLQI